MKNLLITLFCSVLFLSSCKQNFIEAIQEKPAKNLKEAKSRLVGDNVKWNIGEAYENDILIYQYGVNKTNDNDIELEYVKFRTDGVFEIKHKYDGLDLSMRWELDEAKNILSIYDSEYKDQREDWKIEAGSVYESSFTMTYTYVYQDFNSATSNEDKMKLKMIRID